MGPAYTYRSLVILLTNREKSGTRKFQEHLARPIFNLNHRRRRRNENPFLPDDFNEEERVHTKVTYDVQERDIPEIQII